MEWFYLLLIGILSFALVYILVQARVSSTIEKKLNDYYKSQIQGDMQEFYREMESHAAILDSRVGRFKKLIERQEENLQAWDKIYQALKSTKKGKEMNRLFEELQELKREIGQLKSQPMSPSSLPATGPRTPLTPPTPSKSGQTVKTTPQTPPAKTSGKTEPSELPDDLFDDLIDSMDTNGYARQTPAPEKRQTGGALTPSASAPPPPSKEGSLFTGVLASIGKKLMPLLESTAPQTPQLPPSGPASTAGQFDSMLRSNLETPRPAPAEPPPRAQKSSVFRETGPAAQVRLSPGEQDALEKLARELAQEQIEREDQEPLVERDETPQSPPPHSLEKKIDPESLIDLIERLRGPAGRPEALKNLLNSGFNVSQISELSGIPLSDLEMTRSIYNIPTP